jgi:hypothetical protein
VGGWLYGFSSYWLSQLQGHVNLTMTFGPPALLLLVAKRLDFEIGVRRFVLLTAVVIAAQLLSNSEILFTMTVIGAVALALGYAFSAHAMRSRLRALMPPLVAGYALAGVVSAPFLYYAVTGPGFSTGGDKIYLADLLSFAIPTPLTWLGANRFAAVSGGFLAGITETGTYVGLPALVILAAHGIESWASSVRTRVLLITVSIAAVCSLGLTLYIDGHPTIPMPWKLLRVLPGFAEALPIRLGLYVELGVAIAVSLWLAHPPRVRVRRWLAAALAVVFIWPNVNGFVPGTRPAEKTFDESYAQLRFFTDGLYRRYLRPDSVILPIPFGYLGASLLWQAQAHGYFRLASGWFGYWPPDYFYDPMVQELIAAVPFTDSVPEMRSFLGRHHVSAVVMQAGLEGSWAGLMTQLGLHPQAVGGVLLYPVKGLRPAPARPGA